MEHLIIAVIAIGWLALSFLVAYLSEGAAGEAARDNPIWALALVLLTPAVLLYLLILRASDAGVRRG